MKISNNYAHIFENYVEYSPMMFKYWSSSSLIRPVSTDPHKTFLFYFLIIVFNFPYPKTFHTDFYIFLLSLRDYIYNIYMYKLYIDSIYLYLSEWDYWKNVSYRIIIIYTYAYILYCNIFFICFGHKELPKWKIDGHYSKVSMCVNCRVLFHTRNNLCNRCFYWLIFVCTVLLLVDICEHCAAISWYLWALCCYW